MLDFIEQFPAGKGVRDRAYELKKLLLTGVRFSTPDSVEGFSRPQAKHPHPVEAISGLKAAPKLPISHTINSTIPDATFVSPGSELHEGSSGNSVPADARSGAAVVYTETEIADSLQHLKGLQIFSDSNAPHAPSEQVASD